VLTSTAGHRAQELHEVYESAAGAVKWCSAATVTGIHSSMPSSTFVRQSADALECATAVPERRHKVPHIDQAHGCLILLQMLQPVKH
jgi:hypothetical protein